MNNIIIYHNGAGYPISFENKHLLTYFTSNQYKTSDLSMKSDKKTHVLCFLTTY